MRALSSAIIRLVIFHCERYVGVRFCHHDSRFASVRLLPVVEDVAPWIHNIVQLQLLNAISLKPQQLRWCAKHDTYQVLEIKKVFEWSLVNVAAMNRWVTRGATWVSPEER